MIQRDHAALLKPGSRLLAVGLTIGMWSDGVTGSRAFYYQLFFFVGRESLPRPVFIGVQKTMATHCSVSEGNSLSEVIQNGVPGVKPGINEDGGG